MATLAASGKKMEAKQLLSDLGASCLSVVNEAEALING